MSETIKISIGPKGTVISKKRELVSYLDPILKLKTPEWDFNKQPMHPINLSNEMISLLQEYKGIGLACPQVGYSYRMFVMGVNDQIIAYFNPKILEESKETQILEEGCLSFPKLKLVVRRPETVHVEYYDYNGKRHETKFAGLTSRLFQHELNHLDGILFTSKCSRNKLEMAIKKAAKENVFYKIKDLV